MGTAFETSAPMKTPILILVLSGTLFTVTAWRTAPSAPPEPDPGGYADAVLERQRPETYTAIPPAAGARQGSPASVPAMAPVTGAVAVRGASHVPYPVYPNGNQYRIGGEHGLRIVAYQTDDAFAEVDAYYREAAIEGAMPRLEAMQDYVRYSVTAADDDPWATTRPGIVIHELDTDEQRRAVGARHSARTNIIISF